MNNVLRITLILFLLLVFSSCVSTINKEEIDRQNAVKIKIRNSGYSYSSNGFNQAAADGNVDILKLYSNAGFDINKHSVALLYAINKNQLSTVNCLISLGANPNFNNYDGNPLGLAVKKKNKDIVEILLKNGADVDLISVQDSTTPLFKCALYGNSDIAKILINNGANIDYVNRVTNDSVLIACSKSDNLNVAEILLEKGANPNFEDMNGYTALDWAVFNKDIKLAEILIKYNSSLYNKDGNCRICVLEAFKNGELNLVSYMLSYGLNVDSKTPNGMPLIVWCSKLGLTNGVKFLENNKADITAAGPNGMTALDYAMDNKNKEAKSIQLSIKSRLEDVNAYTLEQFKEENNIEDYE